jgi:ferredoxin--NADP+ reductase
LCVRRAVYYDPETGKKEPSKNGVCSNFLCNSKPGDKIQLTGNFLMDEKALLFIYNVL